MELCAQTLPRDKEGRLSFSFTLSSKTKNRDYSFLRVMCVKTASLVVSDTVNKAKEI